MDSRRRHRSGCRRCGASAFPLLRPKDPEWQRERVVSTGPQPVVKLLDGQLVRDRRMTIGPARRRVGRIRPMLAVDVIELLGLAVIGLEIGIVDRPGGRDPAMVYDLTEILLAQAEQRGAVEFGVAADVIMDAGMESPTVLVVPGLLRLVF